MALTEYPLHRDGYVLDAIYRWYDKADWEFVPNAPFEAELVYVKDGYGASNPKFYFLNEETGITYPMFYSEFISLFEAGEFVGTRTTRKMWRVRKRGSAYGIESFDA